MYKYRSFIVNIDTGITTVVIQVKRWYGWCTFCTIESNDAISTAKEIIQCLKKK